LRSWSTALDDGRQPDAEAVALGAERALTAVTRLGGAKPGDKTLVDAFAPFVAALRAGLAAGRDLPGAWKDAAQAAVEAAQATAPLTPRLGRARPLAAKSVGHPDPGAVSLARCAVAIGEAL
jgi:D-erythrulose 4-kinase